MDTTNNDNFHRHKLPWSWGNLEMSDSHVDSLKSSGGMHVTAQFLQCELNPWKCWVQPCIALKLMGLFTMHKHQSFCIQWCKSHIFIGCRIQEIWQHKVTHVNQIHIHWLTSEAHCSKSNGVVTILPHVFTNLSLCCIQWCKSHVHSM